MDFYEIHPKGWRALQPCVLPYSIVMSIQPVKDFFNFCAPDARCYTVLIERNESEIQSSPG
jgi:hypothetical protein